MQEVGVQVAGVDVRVARQPILLHPGRLRLQLREQVRHALQLLGVVERLALGDGPLQRGDDERDLAWAESEHHCTSPLMSAMACPTADAAWMSAGSHWLNCFQSLIFAAASRSWSAFSYTSFAVRHASRAFSIFGL